MTRKEFYAIKNRESLSDFLDSIQNNNFRVYMLEIITNEFKWRAQMKNNEKEN